MTNGHQAVEGAIADMIALRAECLDGDGNPLTDDSADEFQDDVQEPSPDQCQIDLLLPQELNDDILQEVPFTDPTYTAIDGVLLPSRSGTCMRLCTFKTFQGALALQPCIPKGEHLDLFDALQEWEAAGHDIYKEARYWSCNVQSTPDLPTPCRWLAATVFNFASDMLRPDNTQEYMWNMRAWLFHWYDVAEILFQELDIGLEVPAIDWFHSPTGAGSVLWVIREESHEDSRGSNETVVHHVLSPEAPAFYPESVLHPIAQLIEPDLQTNPLVESG
ncbi:hypothetical protein IF1G_07981 [Cordyceps javanica]|uniref:Uncharacterized protein n=1 Tax=Cordyceps javanica TaxID=43265 RepID=A0A545UVA6_9HYPO|nr:hypothetical protein IF1G_07981 [Cordyceps javanica]